MKATAAFLAVMAASLPAQASVFDVYGFGARATAMGNAHAAAARDYTAVYYNPGALTVRKVPNVGTGLSVIAPGLSIDRVQPAGPNSPPNELPGNQVGVNLGLLFPLGGLIENRIALGVGLYLPTVQVMRVDAIDVETPHFHRYEALPDKLVTAIGLAYEIHPKVSVGLGMQVLGTLQGAARVELDALTRRFVRKELEVDLTADSALTAGVHVRPSKALSLGLSYRGPLALEYALVTDLLIQDAGRLVADIKGTSLYTPPQYTLGVAWDPRADITLTADLIWARWHLAPDPSSSFVVTLDGEPLEKGSTELATSPVDLGAEDTLSPHLGAEWRLDPAWALRAGYGYNPSPLPLQTGLTNYIDNDNHQLAVGAGYTFADPLAIHEAPLSLDLTVQSTFLASRTMTKKPDPDESVGSYTSGGQIWHVALQFSHDFY